ncbi:hypothetical protein LG288_09835 [Idiomarina seosinensis]|uniref:hypothetical protein n=1 Tax=Idiomarina seosinensis TaxID=281739 RepID=UPI00384DA8EB
MSEKDNSRERVYQVSSNRGSSKHKLRYVEASLPADRDCRLCVGSLADITEQPKDTEQDDDESSPHEDQ